MSFKNKKNELRQEIIRLKAKLEETELELAELKTKESNFANIIDTSGSSIKETPIEKDNKLNLNLNTFLQLFESMVQGFALHKMIYENDKAIDYQFLFVNKSFEDLTGYKREEVLGKSILKLLPDTEEIWIKNYAKVSESGETMHFENFSRSMNRTYDVVAYCPQKGYFATVFTDISEIKNAEKELKKAKELAEESNKLKTMFLNNMSHEIRTPLNVIIGFTKLLSTKRNITEEQQDEYNKMIIESGDQLVKIIEDILEISALETKQTAAAFEPFSVNDLLNELSNSCKFKSEEKNIPIRIHTSLEYEKSFVVSDRVKLQKILNNLVCNAYKYTKEGEISVDYSIRDNLLEFKIKDTGIGIENKDQRFVFERFSQEDNEINKFYGGLGIGLAIAKENINILGGSISYTSEKNKGTTFILSVPYFRKTLKEKDKSPEQEDFITKGDKQYTLLIAEDEDLNYRFLEIMLRKNEIADFRILRAIDGLEAVQICTSDEHVDLVLMDIMMPRLSGNEAAKIIKEKNPDLPIIAQTAYSGRKEIDLALEHGCDDFVAKPLDADLLFKKIFDLLRKD